MGPPGTSGGSPFETLGAEFLKFAATGLAGPTVGTAQVDYLPVHAGEARQLPSQSVTESC